MNTMDKQAHSDFHDPELQQKLSAYKAPAPSDLLQARILQQAKQQGQTPTAAPKIWRAAIAACLCTVIGGTIWVSNVNHNTPSDDGHIWLTAAHDIDMVDVYLWVEYDGDDEQAAEG